MSHYDPKYPPLWLRYLARDRTVPGSSPITTKSPLFMLDKVRLGWYKRVMESSHGINGVSTSHQSLRRRDEGKSSSTSAFIRLISLRSGSLSTNQYQSTSASITMALVHCHGLYSGGAIVLPKSSSVPPTTEDPSHRSKDGMHGVFPAIRTIIQTHRDSDPNQ